MQAPTPVRPAGMDHAAFAAVLSCLASMLQGVLHLRSVLALVALKHHVHLHTTVQR